MNSLLIQLTFISFIINNIYSQHPDWWKPYVKTTPEPEINTGLPIPYSSQKNASTCCECVMFYLCVDGVIDTSGSSAIDIRMGNKNKNPEPVRNVEVCPVPGEVCCQPPVCPEEPKPEPKDQLPPNTPCLCLAWHACSEELIVSDGLGKTNITLLSGNVASHSQCLNSHHVCCALHVSDFSEEEKEKADIGTTLEPEEEPKTEPVKETKDDCECVEPALCDENGFIITHGAPFINVRFGGIRKTNPSCPTNASLVCCKLKGDMTTTPPTAVTTTPPTAVTTTPPTTDDGEDTTVNINSSLYNILNPFSPNENKIKPPIKCGQRNTEGIQVRISGFDDSQSQFGEFPWVAIVLKENHVYDQLKYEFIGGATLIHPRIVLTAAHKLNSSKEEYVIRFGEWDTRNYDEALPHQDRKIEKIITHPRFIPKALFNDVAIIVLKEDVIMDDHINNICLAETLSSVSHKGCIINGWGRDPFEKKYQVIMKSVELPLVAHDQCQQMLRKTRVGKYFILDKSFICAGGKKGEDACTGDGGGPLACPTIDNPNVYQLVGLTAWGLGCGEEGIPGVYANILTARDWILDYIETHFPVPKSAPPNFGAITDMKELFGKSSKEYDVFNVSTEIEESKEDIEFGNPKFNKKDKKRKNKGKRAERKNKEKKKDKN